MLDVIHHPGYQELEDFFKEVAEGGEHCQLAQDMALLSTLERKLDAAIQNLDTADSRLFAKYVLAFLDAKRELEAMKHRIRDEVYSVNLAEVASDE